MSSVSSSLSSAASSAWKGTYSISPKGLKQWSVSDGIPPHLKFYQDTMRESFFAVMTPLNISLMLVAFGIMYWQFRDPPPVAVQSGSKPILFQTYTPRTLLKYNGENDMPVYLAVRGKVYDVTAGKNFYGPGGPYENFAGRDATRGLACQSFDEDMLTKDLDGDLDDCRDLTEEQLENLQGWIDRFDEKYLVVGALKAFKSLRTGMLRP